MGGWEGVSRQRRYMYTYRWFTLLYSRNTDNIVKWLYSNTNKIKSPRAGTISALFWTVTLVPGMEHGTKESWNIFTGYCIIRKSQCESLQNLNCYTCNAVLFLTCSSKTLPCMSFLHAIMVAPAHLAWCLRVGFEESLFKSLPCHFWNWDLVQVSSILCASVILSTKQGK